MTVEIKLDCLDEPIHLREMSFKGVLALAKTLNPTERSIVMVVYSLCDEKGNLIFTEDDIATLGENIPFPVIQELAFHAAKLTRFDNNSLVK